MPSVFLLTKFLYRFFFFFLKPEHFEHLIRDRLHERDPELWLFLYKHTAFTVDYINTKQACSSESTLFPESWSRSSAQVDSLKLPPTIHC